MDKYLSPFKENVTDKPGSQTSTRARKAPKRLGKYFPLKNYSCTQCGELVANSPIYSVGDPPPKNKKKSACAVKRDGRKGETRFLMMTYKCCSHIVGP